MDYCNIERKIEPHTAMLLCHIIMMNHRSCTCDVCGRDGVGLKKFSLR
jgi:hypothetical protein